MNHTDTSRLLSYMAEPPETLTGLELQEYIWLLEQLLQQTRQREVKLRVVCQHRWGTDGMHSNEFCKKCFESRYL